MNQLKVAEYKWHAEMVLKVVTALSCANSKQEANNYYRSNGLINILKNTDVVQHTQNHKQIHIDCMYV